MNGAKPEQRINYSILLEGLLEDIHKGNRLPRLLLHSCCAPCSSYVLEYLSGHFDITVLFYNPNIFPEEEYLFRKAELSRLIEEKSWTNPVKIEDCDFESERFYETVSGLENEPEGGRRCERCFRLRLERTVQRAAEGGFDYFCTTLSISPLKNAALLNKTGEELAEIYGVPYLPSDFKKRGGYQRSIELSREYNLYRQNFCGCVYSRTDQKT